MQNAINPKTLALFDLDNTLIAGDSDHAWGEFLIEKGMVDAEEHRKQNDQFYADYCKGTLDIFAYQRFALSAIAGKKPEDLQELHDEYVQRMIQPMLLDSARDLLDEHRRLGHYLLVITATNDFVARPIAKMLGADDMMGCTAAIENGVYTGDIEGIPCFQEGKVKRLEQWIAEQTTPPSMAGSYFYSDSHNDLPLLKSVDHPVAVDADEKLSRHASRENWKRISLRQ